MHTSSFQPDQGRPTSISIGFHQISDHSRPLVVAEAGVNHDGDVEQAHHLVDAAAAAGAGAVKFQVFSADALATSKAQAADYQARGGAQTQHQLLAGLELSHRDFEKLARRCEQASIMFLATPFSVADLQVIRDLGVPAIKIASTDLDNAPLLDAAVETKLPLLVSTGASRLSEIDEAVSYLAQRRACGRTVLMHCVSCYPTASTDAAMSTITLLQQRYNLWPGYSDHTESIEAAGLAVACGARLLEKHFTLDRNLDGPDHAFSMSPAMFEQYVASALNAWRMLGEPRQEVAPVEQEVRRLARRSVVASATIRSGARITQDLLALKRPGGGIEPRDLQRLIGKTARQDIPADVQIEWNMV